MRRKLRLVSSSQWLTMCYALGILTAAALIGGNKRPLAVAYWCIITRIVTGRLNRRLEVGRVWEAVSDWPLPRA